MNRSPLDRAKSARHRPDVFVIDLGTLWRFHVFTPTARAWIDEHVEIPRLFGCSDDFVADYRPARSLLEGLGAAGFRVSV